MNSRLAFQRIAIWRLFKAFWSYATSKMDGLEMFINNRLVAQILTVESFRS